MKSLPEERSKMASIGEQILEGSLLPMDLYPSLRVVDLP